MTVKVVLQRDKEAMRVDYLIKALTQDNAKVFADKVGLSAKTVSYLRHGKVRLGLHADKICAAFPQISRQWLLYGEGDAGLPKERAAADYEREIERLWAVISELEAVTKQQRKIIETLLK